MKTAVNAALSNTSTALNILKDIAESLKNAPYIKTIAGVSIQILQIRDQITSNKEVCYRLIDNVATRSVGLVEALEKIKATQQVGLKDLEEDLKRYEILLTDIHADLLALMPGGLRKVKAIFNRDDIKKKLNEYSSQLQEFDSRFSFARLVNIEAKIDKIGAHIPTISTSQTMTSLALPPPPSKFFIGRGDVLVKMADYFSPSVTSKCQRSFALYGMGGAGKTQIALKFIENYSEWFSKIYFVDATTTETLTAAFESIGTDTRLPQPTVAATLRWLSNLREEWLLLFDNADDPSIDLLPFIPPCTHGNVLITSRNPEMRRHAPDAHHHIGGLELDEALSLLSRSAMIPAEVADEKSMTELVWELGFLALAIVQAGAFISSSPGMTVEAYIQLYKANKAELLRQTSRQRVDGYQWTVYTTWEMSFCKLDSLAAQALQLSSYWHHDVIPKAILQWALFRLEGFQLPDGWDDVLNFLANFRDSAGQWSELTFQRVMTQLNSFSLITSNWNDFYSIHPLVHSWARDRDATQENHYATLAARLLALCADYRSLRTAVSSHVRAWMSLQQGIYSSMDVDLAYRFGQVCLHRGWWTAAEDLFLFASQRTESETRVHAMDRLVRVYAETGRLTEADKLMVLLGQETATSYPDDHPIRLAYMANLAVLYENQGRLEEAADLERIVLEKRKEFFGEHDPDTLRSMGQLGITYVSQGRLDEAEELLVSALNGWKNAVGEEGGESLLWMHNLAVNYSKQGRLKQAEDLQLSALDGAKRILGDDHVDTLAILAFLADIYLDQGRFVEAQTLLEDVIPKRKMILGEEHLDTQDSIRVLEEMMAQRGEEEPWIMGRNDGSSGEEPAAGL